jgi:predicted nucleotidyltransferase
MELPAKDKNNLSKKLWDKDMKMSEEVLEKITKIANDFIKSLKVSTPIRDIVITGSMANYNYAPQSDIDIHIIVDLERFGIQKDLAEAFFDAARRIWNSKHDIRIKGHEVEVYVHEPKEVPKSAGSFSILDKEWISLPIKSDLDYDRSTILKKSKDIADQIDNLVGKKNSYEKLGRIKDKITKMRAAGLQAGGERSTENIVFKVLRRNGYLQKLFEELQKQYDTSMSLSEREK